MRARLVALAVVNASALWPKRCRKRALRTVKVAAVMQLITHVRQNDVCYAWVGAKAAAAANA